MDPHRTRYDVIVVGLGAMGASALWQLARRGRRVLGLDAHGVPNAQGSSHGLSRAFRLAYFEHPGYVPLLRRALAGWRELETASGLELLILTGGLYIGRPESDVVARSLAAARSHGLEHELLDEAALRRRWPQFAFFRGAAGVHEPLAGICRVEDTLQALARLAREAGAQLHEGEPVLDWQAGGDGVRVTTGQGVYAAEQLIVAPGAFANGLLRTTRAVITPTRQAVGWFTPQAAERAGPGHFPVWATELPSGQLWYGFAALPGSPGLKLGRHQPGPAVDPRCEPRAVRPAEALELLDFAAHWLPRDAGALAASSICFYENSPDGHFVLDRHPEHANVLLACGGSGHAFKFAPVIGEILADLALDGASGHDIGFLGLQRLAG